MAAIKKPDIKVVDNLKTQLLELLNSLDKLYNQIDSHLNKLGSKFDQVNTVLIDGFENILAKRAPIDVMSDASSSVDDYSLDDD